MVTIEVNLDSFVRLESYIKDNMSIVAGAIQKSALELVEDLGISKKRLPQVLVCGLSFAANISQIACGYFSLPNLAFTAGTIVGKSFIVPESEDGEYLLNKRDIKYLNVEYQKVAQSNLFMGVIGACVPTPLSEVMISAHIALKMYRLLYDH